MPPSASKKYSREYDEDIWTTAKALLNDVPDDVRCSGGQSPDANGRARFEISPKICPRGVLGVMGGRIALIKQRTPAVANEVVEALQQETDAIGCIGELRDSASRLDREGFWWRQGWRALSDGQRPTEPSGESGEWPHGWQYWASSVSDFHLPEGVFTVRPDGCSSGAPSLSLWWERWRRSRHQQQGSTQCHPTCSACCSWSGCNSRCAVVMPPWTFVGTTEQRAPGQGG